MRSRLGCSVMLTMTIAALCAATGCSRQGGPEFSADHSAPTLEVEVVAVERSKIESSLELVGTLFPWKFATIASEVSGIVESIPNSGRKIEYEIDGQQFSRDLPLDIGQRVKKDDVLVRIRSDEAELELKSSQAKLKLVEEELTNLKAWKRSEEVAQLTAQLEESAAVLADAEADLERAKSLRSQNAISTQEVEDAVRGVATAGAAKKKDEAALQLAQAGPTAEQIAVAVAQVALSRADVDMKQERVDKCTIRCPLETGAIVERYVSTGDHVTANPSTPLVRVVDPSLLLAQVSVPERYQGMIKTGDLAAVHAEGGMAAEMGLDGVPAMVVLVNAQIDPETRAYRIRVGIDNSQNLFKAGTFVKVKIPIRAASDAVVVPAEAITFANGAPAAFVFRDGHVEKRPVVLGISNATHYEVVSGLTESDQVVKGGLTMLADGLQVARKKSASITADSQG